MYKANNFNIIDHYKLLIIPISRIYFSSMRSFYYFNMIITKSKDIV
jgi:hypothetical protein